MLRSHRDALADASRAHRRPVPNGDRQIDATLRALLAGGFSEEAAMQAAALLNSYVTGLVLEEDLGPTGAAGEPENSPSADAWLAAITSGNYPSLGRILTGLRDSAAFGPEQRFTFGLEVLLAGLEWQLRQGAAQS